MYENVFFEDSWWRMYDETTTNSLDCLYSETQIKLIELIEKYNFKVLHIECTPITRNKVIIKNDNIDLNEPRIETIKKNQCSDFYYLYINRLCEVVYSFSKINDKNVYYYDLMVVVKQDFNVEDLYKHKFKTIKIKNIKEFKKEDITFELIKQVFESRVQIDNDNIPCLDKKKYDLNKVDYSSKKYAKKFKQDVSNFDLDGYLNFSSFYYYKRLNQHKYAKNCFRMLCSQIWAVDRTFYIEKNKFGLRLMYKELYDLNSGFVTNFAGLVGAKSINLENGVEIKNMYYTYSSLLDNITDQGFLMMIANKEYFKKKLDLANLEVVEKV